MGLTFWLVRVICHTKRRRIGTGSSSKKSCIMMCSSCSTQDHLSPYCLFLGIGVVSGRPRGVDVDCLH